MTYTPPDVWLATPNGVKADIATWPWYGALALGRLYDASDFDRIPHVR